MNNIHITHTDVLDVLRTLSVGKASGPDGIDNRILVEAASQLVNPLCRLFNLCLDKSALPSSWKRSHVCPILKKGDPSIPSNYRPVSLLNTMEKVFERIIFKYVYNHLHVHRFFTSSQSGFILGDSTVNQLTFLYDKICRALDNGLETRAVFFDISKAFDKVWHRGLIFKLESAGINGNLLRWFQDYLSNRYQKVIIPGGSSDLCAVKAGVPQGSILGPLLFLVYINDIVNDIESDINLFADDTSLIKIVENPSVTSEVLQSDINKIQIWAEKWLVQFNPSKSESLIISRKRNKPAHPILSMSNVKIPSLDNHKHLGIYLSNNGTWDLHLRSIIEKAWQRIGILRHLKYKLDFNSLQTIYFAFIRPLLEYGDVVWDNLYQYQKDELDKIQNEAARIVTGCTKLVSIVDLNKESGWESLGERRRKHRLILFYKMVNGLAPEYLSSLVPVANRPVYNLRNTQNLQNIACRTNLYQNSFLPATTNEWNNLPQNVKKAESLSCFKRQINIDKPVPNKQFHFGERRIQIIHTQLRNNCSSLNQHLFFKNIVDSPLCYCGKIESNKHFFLECGLYQRTRQILRRAISEIATFNLRTILFGVEDLSFEENKNIFTAVHEFIKESGRF